VGAVPAGFPAPRLPSAGLHELTSLLPGACGIALVSFCSMMTTARGFAAKNGYAIDPNRDLIALGASNVASGFNHGFVVSGADSRTAVADSSGGKTRATAIVAAVTMAIVLLFFTGPLSLLPKAALAAILFSSAIGLFDWRSLGAYWRVSRPEFVEALVAMVGVMTVGVLPGVIVAVSLALIRLVRSASHPHDAVLGLLEGKEDDCTTVENGKPIPGLLIYRFDSALVFFNADRFAERVLALRGAADLAPRWLLIDAESMPMLDVSAADRLEALRAELAAAGVVLAIARSKGLFRVMLDRSGLSRRIGEARLFPTVHQGVRAFLAEREPPR
jgi:MFS superfamily sulfate permease-like transporter